MRRSRVVALGSALLAAVGLVVACGGDVVLGDDTASSDAGGGGDAAAGDAQPDGALPPGDAGDAAVASSCVAEGGTCAPSGVGHCTKVDTTGLTCASAGEICCLVSCPELQQPPPGFCDGGPVAQTYAANGCVNGFACAPVTCAAAGGACVGLAPGTCPSNHVGEATRYSCGGGLGTMCCLP